MSLLGPGGQDTDQPGVHQYQWLRVGNPAQIQRVCDWLPWLQTTVLGGVTAVYYPDAVSVWAQMVRLHQDAEQLTFARDPPNGPALARALLAIMDAVDSTNQTMTEAAV